MAPCFQHGYHVFLLFMKPGFLAINTAWINLSLGGNTSLHVFFIVEYQFCLGTSFSMDTWRTYFSRTCHLSCLTSLPCHYVTLLGNIKS